MSDYMFMLESRLSAEQNRVLEQVIGAAGASGANLFLTGGGMRDMLGGFRIRDLDFSVEGDALKLARMLEPQGARILALDENRRSAELVFPSGVTAQVALSRKERYSKTGGQPQVAPAAIQEDLRGRDFTINAMALSLNRASRGLLLDPTNGLADLGYREMRSTHPYIFHDDPARMLRLVRLRVRLGFTVEERTATQYHNARAAQLESLIPARALGAELQQIALEPSPSEAVQALAQDGLLPLFSPALAGSKLNLPALLRLEKAERLVESANLAPGPKFARFYHALTAKLTPKEKSALLKAAEIPNAEIDSLRTIEPQARKLEQALESARVKKPSHVYRVLAEAPVGVMVFVLANSAERTVQERIRNYLQKYLPAMQEAPPAEWEALERLRGTAKYSRTLQAFLAARLDVRPRKQAEPEPEPPGEVADVPMARGRAR